VSRQPWEEWMREPHGTLAAARRHYRAGEKPCRECREADAAAKRARVNPSGRTRSEAQQARRAREREGTVMGDGLLRLRGPC